MTYPYKEWNSGSNNNLDESQGIKLNENVLSSKCSSVLPVISFLKYKILEMENRLMVGRE